MSIPPPPPPPMVVVFFGVLVFSLSTAILALLADY